VSRYGRVRRHDHPGDDRVQRHWHERTAGGEDDRRVPPLRRTLVRRSGPGGAELARERLRGLVAGSVNA